VAFYLCWQIKQIKRHIVSSGEFWQHTFIVTSSNDFRLSVNPNFHTDPITNLYAGYMPSCIFNLARIAATAMFVLASPWSPAMWLYAMQTDTKSAPSPIDIQDLGKGTVPLSGPWQFHIGDNPEWADPAFDSSGWEQLSADQPWGKQGHDSLTGYAWYRCSITLTPASGIPAQFSLMIPKIDDAYEIYWNGVLIGRNGKLPPHPVWYVPQPPQIFQLGPIQHGVLAVRVWAAPLFSDSSGEQGGFVAAPLIGSPSAIAAAKAADEFGWLRSQQFHFGETLLCVLIAFLSFLLWCRAPTRWVLFWTAGFALGQPVFFLLLYAHIGWQYTLAQTATQLVSAVQDVSLWFLLLWLLLLRENHALSRLTRILACICIVSAALDGLLIAIIWTPEWAALAQISDAVLTFVFVLLEAFPLILVSYALFQRKQQLDPARWMVAILAFLDEMMIVFDNIIQQGRRFTHWSIATNIDAPLITIHGSAISLRALSASFLLVAIVVAVYNNVREDQRRNDLLEQEKKDLLRESNRMRHEAEHDGLTGLWNHRIIVERLNEEMSRSFRNGTPLSVVLIDVDHFKKINDTFGHLAGDLVLKEVSAIFTSALRSYDGVGRYGGEEFLLILPNCEIESALLRAEQLRQAVQSAQIMDGDTMLQVTASFGVASAFPAHYEAETVIRAVDTALYQAKSNGRNCVIQADTHTPLYES
jgi:diguanylate cyclase (GGDEF)-like protein